MEKVILALAIILGIFFRVWQIDNIPAGLAMDEAAFGYNAWAIGYNGHDEYGKFLPLSFRSFADFKLPAYGYLTAVVVKFFGPGVWQTRGISILAGLACCLLLFLIVRRITDNKRLATLSALIMLWSPWGVLFSRGAFEGNLGLFFLMLGAYGLVKFRDHPKYLYLTAVSFALANYSYITYKFVGFILLFVWLIAYRGVHKFSKSTLVSVFIFLIISAPAYLSLFGISGNNRISSLLKLSPKETGYPAVIQLTSSYLSYFSPRNLFFRPDPVRQRHFSDLSTFYPWMFVLWLAGVVVWFKTRKTELAKWIGIVLIVGPIPAAISQDPFATLRAIPMLPAYATLLALGAERLLELVKREYVKIAALAAILVFTCVSLYSALTVMKNGQVAEWNGGVEPLAKKLTAYPNRPVFVDIPHDVYPNLALALAYPPAEMQKANADFDLDKYYSDPVFSETIAFGRYRVGKTDRSKAAEVPGALLVVRPENTSASELTERSWKGAFEINDPSGKPLFLVYELN